MLWFWRRFWTRARRGGRGTGQSSGLPASDGLGSRFARHREWLARRRTGFSDEFGALTMVFLSGDLAGHVDNQQIVQTPLQVCQRWSGTGFRDIRGRDRGLHDECFIGYSVSSFDLIAGHDHLSQNGVAEGQSTSLFAQQHATDTIPIPEQEQDRLARCRGLEQQSCIANEAKPQPSREPISSGPWHLF